MQPAVGAYRANPVRAINNRLRTVLAALVLLLGASTAVVTLTASPAAAASCGEVLATVDGVDVKSNGANQNTATSCGGSTQNTAQTPSGTTVTTGYKWQCVEFVNRYYVQHGWISARVSGNGNTLKDHLPAGLTYMANGSITSIVVGDAVTLDGNPNNTAGHVGVVSSISGNTITIANQNSSSVSGTSTYDPVAKTLTSEYNGYTTQGVVHASANTGPNGGTIPSISSQITADGAQHVYVAAGNYLSEVAWGNGAPLVQWNVWNAGAPVKALSSQITSDGVQHVYAAVGSTVSDISWGNGAPLIAWQVGSFSTSVTYLSSQYVAGVQHVFAGTSNGSINEIAWGNGTPLTQWQVTNLGSSINGLSSMVASGVTHVFASSGNSVHDISWGNGAPLTVWLVWNAGGQVSQISSQITSGVLHVFAGIGSDVYDISWGNGNPLTRWKVGTLSSGVNSLSSQIIGGVLHVYPS